MKKVLVTVGMLMLLISSLALGANLAIRNIRVQDDRVIERYMEIQKQNCTYHMSYDCTIIEEEPSVPFFSFRNKNTSYNRKLN